MSTLDTGAARALVSGAMDPGTYATMIEVCEGVDAIDRRIVALLAERFAYRHAAARTKPECGQVRDEGCKAQLIANARTEAARLAVPGDLVAELWDRLVEGSIAYETDELDRLRTTRS